MTGTDLTRWGWPHSLPGAAERDLPRLIRYESSRVDPGGPKVTLRPLARILIAPKGGRVWHRLAWGSDLTTRCGIRLDAETAVDADCVAASNGRRLCSRCWPPAAGHAAELGQILYWDHRLQTIRPGGGGEDDWLTIEGTLCLLDVVSGIRAAFDLRARRRDPGPMTADGPFAPLRWWADQMNRVDVLGIHVTTAPGVRDAADLVRDRTKRLSTRSSLKAVAALAIVDAGRPVTLAEAGEMLGWKPKQSDPSSAYEEMLEAVALDVMGLRWKPELPRGQREAAVRRIFRQYRGRSPADGYERQIMMAVRERERSAE